MTKIDKTINKMTLNKLKHTAILKIAFFVVFVILFVVLAIYSLFI